MDWMESWWNQRHHDNILIIKYEDMLQDLAKEMKRIIHFLELDVTEKTFERVLHDATFGAMKKNPQTNYEKSMLFDQSRAKFIRSGKVGEWKEYFTVARNEWFDQKYEQRLQASGMQLKF